MKNRIAERIKRTQIAKCENCDKLLDQMDSEITYEKEQLLNSLSEKLRMEFNDYNKIKDEPPSEKLSTFCKVTLDRIFKKLDKAGVKF